MVCPQGLAGQSYASSCVSASLYPVGAASLIFLPSTQMQVPTASFLHTLPRGQGQVLFSYALSSQNSTSWKVQSYDRSVLVPRSSQ